jgi:hypothetical protein
MSGIFAVPVHRRNGFFASKYAKLSENLPMEEIGDQTLRGHELSPDWQKRHKIEAKVLRLISPSSKEADLYDALRRELAPQGDESELRANLAKTGYELPRLEALGEEIQEKFRKKMREQVLRNNEKPPSSYQEEQLEKLGGLTFRLLGDGAIENHKPLITGLLADASRQMRNLVKRSVLGSAEKRDVVWGQANAEVHPHEIAVFVGLMREHPETVKQRLDEIFEEVPDENGRKQYAFMRRLLEKAVAGEE